MQKIFRIIDEIMKINPFSTLPIASFLVSTAIVAMTSCGTREKTSDNSGIDTTRYELAQEDSIEKDAPQQLETEMDFDGKHYVINVKREPGDSLAKVYDSSGLPFLDNVVNITVKSGDKTIIDRTFTKKDFSAAAQGLALDKNVLGGMVFTNINGSGILFNAQLCPPDNAEEGRNFRISFSLSGSNMKIEADDLQEDHSSNDDN